ncbi:MAG: phospholipase D-like domain-containing protein, partial [Nocardioidaceae bacterium]
MKRVVAALVVLLTLAAAALAAPSTATAGTRRPTWSPGHHTPAGGPHFNNPLGGKTARRTLLRQVNNAIMSVRGYRVRNPRNCPADPARYPAEIKISLYSIADMAFVDRLIAADRRCISVQLLMNDHLDSSTSPSWARLVRALGSNRKARSFAYRCTHSCRGNAILHSKFYLFSQAGKARDVVMVGSSNMTTNASGVQWNDLMTVKDNPGLYGVFRQMFEEMVPDVRRSSPLRVFDVGQYQAIFFPQPGANPRTDQAMKLLRTIHCRGAEGGAGSHGRTVVEINMHAWKGDRGLYLAREVHDLYDQGCVIHVLYSFMWKRTYQTLVHGTGPRMDARRTIFPRPYTDVAAIYSHMKTVAVSGNVGDDPSSWVVWTGSANFSDLAKYSDEVILRVPRRNAYEKYAAHNAFIRRTKSSPVWAIYQEPAGGGREP